MSRFKQALRYFFLFALILVDGATWLDLVVGISGKVEVRKLIQTSLLSKYMYMLKS